VKGGDKVIKYPEELKQDEMLKNLERLQAKKLKRREAEIKIMKEKGGNVLEDKMYFIGKDGLYVNQAGKNSWGKISEGVTKKEVDE